MTTQDCEIKQLVHALRSELGAESLSLDGLLCLALEKIRHKLDDQVMQQHSAMNFIADIRRKSAAPDGNSFVLLEWIDAQRKDAENYRFLRSDFSPMGVNIDGRHAWVYRRNATLIGPTLDDAIAAAMAARLNGAA